MALARRGLTMLRAKRAIEALVEDGRVFVELRTVEDPDRLAAEIAEAGIAAAVVEPPIVSNNPETVEAAFSPTPSVSGRRAPTRSYRR